MRQVTSEDMIDNYEMHVRDAATAIRSKTKGFSPEFGFIAGTGLGGIVDVMNVECEIPYSEIPQFLQAGVKGHDGVLYFGTLNDVKVMAMKGRIHYFEVALTPGGMLHATLPINVMPYTKEQ